jgi:superoxide dismutase, Cu-Zn family
VIKKVLAIVTATLTMALAGLLVFGTPASAHNAEFRAKLRDADGRTVGHVEFRIRRHVMHVEAELRPNDNVEAGQFHGFHVHANNSPDAGVGCVADPSLPSSTWFLSADGHLSDPGQMHGEHLGDLPSPLVLEDGSARLQFTTDRLDPRVLVGTAVILHDRPDNFNNVPADQYTPRTTDAIGLTGRTGNAGDRVACGLLWRYW